jgi:hypothetical protein
MSTDFTLGFGSQIYVSTDGDTYTLIAQSKDLNSPSSEVGTVNITNNSSPNFSEEVAAGLYKPGTIDFEWIYTPTQQATLYGYWNSAPSQTLFFKEIFTDASGWTFSGFLTKIENETKTENEAIMGKVSVQLTVKAVYVSTGLTS